MRKPINRSAKTLVGHALLLALTLGLVSDTRPPLTRIRLAFVGLSSREQDPVFSRFRVALERRHPLLARRADWVHVVGPIGDDVAIERAVLVALASRPAVLVTPTGGSSRIAARHAGPVPLVFSTYSDPISLGVRDSLQRSWSATTGVSLHDELDEKRLELLLDAFPWVKRVTALTDRSWAQAPQHGQRFAALARDLGLYGRLVVADSAVELERAMEAENAASTDAWYVPATGLSYRESAMIIHAIQLQRLPSIHTTLEEVRAGALMAYEQDSGFAIEAMADLVARICAGEFAGDIPVQTPQRYELAVRLNTESGMQPSLSAIRRATVVIR